MKIEYIQNVNAVQSLSDLIMELRIACFGKHLKNWIWMLVMPHGFTTLHPIWRNKKNVLISMNTYICQKIRLRSILIKKENVI